MLYLRCLASWSLATCKQRGSKDQGRKTVCLTVTETGTQMKLQFYTESWWGNCTRNCVSQSSCWQEHHFLHSCKWFEGPTRTTASKATIHYSVKPFIHFHHVMKWMERRGMDHDGASTAEPQNKNFLILPPLLNPSLAWLPLSNAHLKDEPTWTLELKPGTNEKVLSHSKTNALICQETLLIQMLPRGQAMRQLPWLCPSGQKTHTT